MKLDGFVSVSSTQNIQTKSTNNNTYQFANQFRYVRAPLHLLAYALASKRLHSPGTVSRTACFSTQTSTFPSAMLSQ